MPQGNPKSGERYRHFKNKLYQIVTIARHSETGEPLVIYQALYGDFCVYARPLSMFISSVDHEKYPDVAQEYRFELVEMQEKGQDREETKENLQEPAGTQGTQKPATPEGIQKLGATGKDITELLMDFYDAATYEEKYNILTAMRDGITNVMVDNMAVVLDVVIPEGELDKRYEELRRCLKTHRKFETTRS